MADRIPHIVGMMSEVAHDDVDATLGWCDDQFEFGLDLIQRTVPPRARLEVYEPEAAVVRRIFDDYVIRGCSIRQTVHGPAADGIVSPTGKPM